TLQCIEIALLNPPAQPEYRVYNQFTEVLGVFQLAEAVRTQGDALRLRVALERIEKPRGEKEEHYYQPVNHKLLNLGLKPRYLSSFLLHSMLIRIQEHRHRIRRDLYGQPKVHWRRASV